MRAGPPRPARARTLQRRRSASTPGGVEGHERDASRRGWQPHGVPDGLRERVVVGRVPPRAARARRRRLRHRRGVGQRRPVALPRRAPQRHRRADHVARRGGPPHPLRHRGRPAVGMRPRAARRPRRRRQGHAPVLLLLRGGSARRGARSQRPPHAAARPGASQARTRTPAGAGERGAQGAQHRPTRVQAVRADAERRRYVRRGRALRPDAAREESGRQAAQRVPRLNRPSRVASRRR